jgi:cytochrome P450
MTRHISSPSRTHRSLPGATLLALQRDPTGFVSAMAAEYGDIVRFRLGAQPTLLLSDPDHIRDVLVSKTFARGRALQRAGRLLGEGLLTSEGEFHRRQRRLVAPAFHRQRIAAYGERMACLAEAHQARWQPGQTVDMAAEMMRLTLRIAGDTLFGANTDATAAEVAAAMHDLLGLFTLVPLPFSQVLERLPLPSTRRFHAASLPRSVPL